MTDTSDAAQADLVGAGGDASGSDVACAPAATSTLPAVVDKADKATRVPTIKAMVVRGTVHTAKGPIGPGGTVQLTVADHKRLAELGFFHVEGTEAPDVVQNGQVQVKSGAGPNVTVV